MFNRLGITFSHKSPNFKNFSLVYQLKGDGMNNSSQARSRIPAGQIWAAGCRLPMHAIVFYSPVEDHLLLAVYAIAEPNSNIMLCSIRMACQYPSFFCTSDTLLMHFGFPMIFLGKSIICGNSILLFDFSPFSFDFLLY